ncbi:MAG: beta-glucosidase [Acidobacteriota bacterium]|nr:beta-glucosidase [Acidobacteriota bacterium]
MPDKGLFQSFFMGGFECSTHRRRIDRKRLDMIAATAHDRFVVEDYERLRAFGMTVARDGIRWHLIEKTPYNYDFSSVLPMIRAARELGIQVIWDLCHYGFPDDLSIFEPEFVRRYVRLARAFTELHRNETDSILFVAPINEISFFSWASGEVGYFYPFARRRGNELKTQLVRAAIEGIEAIWSVDPQARIVQIDPLINVVGRSARNQTAAENYRLSQYQAWDMLAGRLQPELGGAAKYLDIIGVNYYRDNQWFHPGGKKIARGQPLYRPFRNLLRELYERYRRPVFIAETGIEFDARIDWLRYIGREVRAAMRSGVPIEGICWYAIINCPGWDNERHCYNGLWDYANEAGEREIYVPLARELRRQMRLFGQIQTTQGKFRNGFI